MGIVRPESGLKKHRVCLRRPLSAQAVTWYKVARATENSMEAHTRAAELYDLVIKGTDDPELKAAAQRGKFKWNFDRTMLTIPTVHFLTQSGGSAVKTQPSSGTMMCICLHWEMLGTLSMHIWKRVGSRESRCCRVRYAK